MEDLYGGLTLLPWWSLLCVRSPSPGACNYPIFQSRRFHRPIYLNLSRIQIPTGTSVTNCNYKHGLMLTCRHLPVDRHDVDMFTWRCIVLSLPKRIDVDWNWPISRKKISKTRLVRCKNAVVLAYYGSCRLLVMGCCSSTESKFLSCSNYPSYGEVVRARDKLVSRTRKPLPGSYIFFALSLHPFGK